MAIESDEDKIMYAFGAALASQTDQFKKVKEGNKKNRCQHFYFIQASVSPV